MRTPAILSRTRRWQRSAVALAGALLVLISGTTLAAEGKKVYIITDLEGISGVFQFSQTRETDTPVAREAREYFMGDLAAVVRGLRDGGASEVVVLDGHGNMALIPHLMAPGARYITGRPLPKQLPELDTNCVGVVFLGFHAMMGTADGVLHHTQSSKTEHRYWYNGVESGEIAQCAALAGHFEVPTILVTGDDATCREAKTFLGEEVVTVSVKKGLGREAAILYPFEETRRALHEGAKRAMGVIGKCRPYKLDLPIQARKEYLSFEDPKQPKLNVKEGTIPDALHILRGLSKRSAFREF
ncbi:MAG: M55 family metallopeptidase [Verrucomicrobiia bacterium]